MDFQFSAIWSVKMTDQESTVPSNDTDQTTHGKLATHDKHCFVVMPYGHTIKENRWFKGWYDVVIKKAVIDSGYEPKLSATEEHPSAINDEIRAHLAFDPMVVIDLGGFTPEDEPNPNVMYELGIRHALGLPLVMMAWKGQRLPFDVGNQRVIMEGRDLLDLEINRKKLCSFIGAASAGHYYRPMDAVGRIAALEQASLSLSEDSVLGALVREVNELRTTMTAYTKQRSARGKRPTLPTVKRLLGGKQQRSELYAAFASAGGTNKQWAQFLKTQFTDDMVSAVVGWTLDDWKEYAIARIPPLLESSSETQESESDYSENVDTSEFNNDEQLKASGDNVQHEDNNTEFLPESDEKIDS